MPEVEGAGVRDRKLNEIFKQVVFKFIFAWEYTPPSTSASLAS